VKIRVRIIPRKNRNSALQKWLHFGLEIIEKTGFLLAIKSLFVCHKSSEQWYNFRVLWLRKATS